MLIYHLDSKGNSSLYRE